MRARAISSYASYSRRSTGRPAFSLRTTPANRHRAPSAAPTDWSSARSMGSRTRRAMDRMLAGQERGEAPQHAVGEPPDHHVLDAQRGEALRGALVEVV